MSKNAKSTSKASEPKDVSEGKGASSDAPQGAVASGTGILDQHFDRGEWKGHPRFACKHCAAAP